MNKITALHSGTYYNLVSLLKEPFAKYFHKCVYLPELKKSDLDDCDILLVTDSLVVRHLEKNKELFKEFLKSGRTLVIGGRNEPQLWLEGIEYKELPFNFWWWLDKEHNDIDITPDDTNHELFKYIDFKDLIWHFHGGYKKLNGAKSAIKSKLDESVSVYQECSFGGGNLILTSLDPFFHHGCFFMPNASKFGAGLLERLMGLKV